MNTWHTTDDDDNTQVTFVLSLTHAQRNGYTNNNRQQPAAACTEPVKQIISNDMLVIWYDLVVFDCILSKLSQAVSHSRRLFSLKFRMPLWDTQRAISIDCLTLDSVHLTLKFGAHCTDFKHGFMIADILNCIVSWQLKHCIAPSCAHFFSLSRKEMRFPYEPLTVFVALHYESCACTVYQSRSVCCMHECVQFGVECMKRKKDGHRFSRNVCHKQIQIQFQFSIAKSQLPWYVHWTEREAFVKSSMQNISRLFLHLSSNLNQKNGAAQRFDWKDTNAIANDQVDSVVRIWFEWKQKTVSDRVNRF